MSVWQTKVFQQQQQYLDEAQTKALKRAIKAVSKKPQLGKAANASLADILVYRFGMLNKPWLLGIAYRQSAQGLTLLALNMSRK
ncbi:MAG: hypothetical protein CMF39_03930 [Legionellaceae bacterium]|nr:hypothetical protein [Legionellaceae bacterium]|tara:strand:- start:328 stop:579 length:252 start_codon:yes stop_codon:yes gene_type:complete